LKLEQFHDITCTSEVNLAPPSIDLPTKSWHVKPLRDSSVKTPRPLEGLEESIDSRESVGLGATVVLVKEARAAEWTCVRASERPAINATATTAEVKRIHNVRVERIVCSVIT
jgi:hypothetical protein